MRTATDAQKIEALKMARAHLKRKHSNYICFALTSVAARHNHLGAACKTLKVYILNQLYPCITYEGWLTRNRHVPFGNQTRTGLRAGRLAWIDWMIEQLETKP